MGDEEIRTAAVWALSQFHDPEVLPVLLSEAERPHPTLQSYLAHVLGGFQDARVVPTLAKLTEHPNREVSFQAACALAETGYKSALSAIKKNGRRNDPLIRAASAAALKRLGGRPSRFSPLIIGMGILVMVLVGSGVGWLIYK